MFLKRISAICFLVMILILSSCNDSVDCSIISTDDYAEIVTTTVLAAEEVTIIPSEKACYAVVEESDPIAQLRQYKALDWSKVADTVEEKYYEAYDGLHTAPTSATLYKNGEIISISLNDTRLVKLLNFYHNSIYNNMCAVLQGRYDIAYYNEFISAPFRLELTFKSINDKSQLRYDKVIVSGYTFVCIDSYIQTTSNIPFATGNFPYNMTGTEINWLDAFGF